MCCQFSNKKQGEENGGGILISMKTTKKLNKSFMISFRSSTRAHSVSFHSTLRAHA